MKKNVTAIALLLLITGMLSGCGHQHVWKEATCTKPKICTECEETEGSPLGHAWIDASCTAPKTCSVCGETEGNTLAHTWTDASCTAPKTCSVCGETEGNTLAHTWIEASCTVPKTCSVCGKTEGITLAHTWIEANYQTPKTCSVCEKTEGKPLTAGFDEYDSLTVYTAEDGTYDFVTSSASDTSKKATGKLYVSGYRVFEGDATYEAKEGYEWRTVHVVLSASDVSFSGCVIDYYVPGRINGSGERDNTHGWTTYPLYYYGVKYPECAAVAYRSWNPLLNEYEMDAYFRVPIGYDGAVLSIYDGILQGAALFEIVPHENTVHIRLTL